MAEYEPITFERDCTVIQVPDGYNMLVSEGTSGIVMQVLGGNFTVRLATGYLVRIHGTDADAIGKEATKEEAIVLDGDGELSDEVVWSQLRTCYDPEIPINIVELGLVYGFEMAEANDKPEVTEVKIEMTLTAPGCGMGQVLVDDVENAVERIPGIGKATVDLVFDPPWEPSRMSEVARLQLGFD
jgi:probable FeS assembly SUF system protein SufT